MRPYMKPMLRRAFCLIDAVIVFISYILVDFLLENHGETAMHANFVVFNSRFFAIFIAAVVNIIVQWILGCYRVLWRSSSIREYSICALGAFLSAAALLIGSLLVHGSRFFFPWDVQIIAGLFIAFGFVITRLVLRNVVRIYVKKRQDKTHKAREVRMLLVGAGGGAIRIISEVLSGGANYKIVGLVDDDLHKQKMQIRGYKVLGTRKDIPRLCEKYDVEEVLLAIPSIRYEDRSEILEIINRTGRKARVLPSLDEIVNYDTFTAGIRDVQIEDLLQRDSINLDNQKIKGYIQDKVVLVTGGGGSIGSELCRQILKFAPKKLYILDIYENNAYDLQMDLKRKRPDSNFEVIIASVRDRERIDAIFNSIRPNLVFHAAAHKHVPLMEHDPSEAIKNNVIGTYNVATASDKYGVERFVLVSTDKAVNPTNVMGATKRVCEMIIQSINATSKTEYVAVRFGNVLGSNGSVVPLFKKQIAERSPITLTHKEITRFFMTIPEAVSLILEAASYAEGGEIFILDMGQPVKIYDLAVKLIQLSGLEVDRDIPILITGLRPGEKLYEELLMNEEGLRATTNEKIFVAKPMTLDWDALCEQLSELENSAKVGDAPSIKAKLQSVVPTYKSPSNEMKHTNAVSATDMENPEAANSVYA